MTHVRKLVGLSIAVMLVVWAAGTSLAAVPDTTKSKQAQTHKTEHSMIRAVYGTVSAVTPGTKTIEVTVPKGKSNHLVVGATVTDQTVIKEGKAKKSLADLKVGEHVRMKFERVRTGDVAKLIVIKTEKQHS